MPVHREARGGKHAVVDDAGRVYGRHATVKEADAQVAAVNNALKKRDTGKGFLPPKKTEGGKKNAQSEAEVGDAKAS